MPITLLDKVSRVWDSIKPFRVLGIKYFGPTQPDITSIMYSRVGALYVRVPDSSVSQV